MIMLHQVLGNRYKKIKAMVQTKEICPICRGDNPKCAYFLWKNGLDHQTFYEFEPNLEQFRRQNNIKKLFLEELKEKLVGEKMMFPIGHMPHQLDTENDITVNFIYLNLGDSFKEIPLLDLMGGLFRLRNPYTPERACSVNVAAIPVMVFQPQGVGIDSLDEAAQQNIIVRYKAALDAVDQGTKKDWYAAQRLELIPVYLDRETDRVIIDLTENDYQPNGYTVLVQRAIAQVEEFVYWRFSLMEESWCQTVESQIKKERFFRCTDLEAARKEFLQVCQEISEVIWAKTL